MRVIAVVLAGAALLVACSNDPPPQGNSPPLVSTRPPSAAPSTPSPSVTPSETPTETPTVDVADTLCSRADQAALTRILKARRLTMRSEVTPLFGVPTYDVCAFTATPVSGKPYTLRIGASVLPAGPADLAAARRTY